MILGYKESLDTFLGACLNGYLLYGSHARHIEEFVQLSRVMNNLLMLRNEDLKLTLDKVLLKTSHFLNGRSAPMINQDLKHLASHLSFEQMRQNGSCNNERMSKNAIDMNGREGEEQFQ